MDYILAAASGGFATGVFVCLLIRQIIKPKNNPIIELLRDKKLELESKNSDLRDKWSVLNSENRRLRKRIAAANRALVFYADQVNYTENGYYSRSAQVHWDNGEIARTTLAEVFDINSKD